MAEPTQLADARGRSARPDTKHSSARAAPSGLWSKSDSIAWVRSAWPSARSPRTRIPSTSCVLDGESRGG